jgi:hypothetical protein
VLTVTMYPCDRLTEISAENEPSGTIDNTA